MKWYIYTDGACQGNGKENAVGGWSYVYSEDNITYKNFQYGGEVGTTNNQMELKAVLQGLLNLSMFVNFDDEVQICSDSKYFIKCMKERWYDRWRRNGWKNSNGQSVANQELWSGILDLIEMIGENTITFKWVKGHSGIVLNELADKLAVTGLTEAKEKMKGDK